MPAARKPSRWSVPLPAELQANTGNIRVNVVEVRAGCSCREIEVAPIALAIKVFGKQREARCDVIRHAELYALVGLLPRQRPVSLVFPVEVRATHRDWAPGIFITRDPGERVRPTGRKRRHLTVV